MKAWLVVLFCACEQKPKEPLPPAPVPVVIHDAQEAPRPDPVCFRRRKTRMSNCTGVPSMAGSSEVEVCDECADDTQCTWKPGGKCSDVGDGICYGPVHKICKYPEPACGNQICPEPEYSLPPSSPGGPATPPVSRP